MILLHVHTDRWTSRYIDHTVLTLCIEFRFLEGVVPPVATPLLLAAPSVWSSLTTLISGPMAEPAVDATGPLSDVE